MLVFGLLANLNGNTQTGVLKGKLTDNRTDEPVANATVQLLDTEFSTQSDTNGAFRIDNIPAQDYTLKITAPGYYDITMLHTKIHQGMATEINYSLTGIIKSDNQRLISLYADEVQSFVRLTGNIAGRVIDQDGNPISDAAVSIQNTRKQEISDSAGNFTFNDINLGIYRMRVSKKGYPRKTISNVEVSYQSTQSLDIELRKYEIANLGEYPEPGKAISKEKGDFDLALIFPDKYMKRIKESCDSGYGVICGQILESEYTAPLPSATIQLNGTKIGAMTDINGLFLILNIPPGRYAPLIRNTGYDPIDYAEIEIAPQKIYLLQAAMNVSSIGMWDQVVTTSGDNIKLDEVNNIRTMSAEEINALPVQDVDDILSYQVGVVTRNGEINVRGGRQVGDIKIGKPACAKISPSPAQASQGQWLPHGGSTPPNGEAYSGTFFKHYGVNPFVDTEDDHFSTFAIDVDDASYTLARSYLERGHLPDPASVRTEEFVNFFNYEYAPPQEDRFNVFVEGAPSCFGQNCDLLRVGIKGQMIDPENRKPAVLTFVIDISGSMDIDSRLGLVKQALKILVDNLKPDDMVGIAVYGSCGQKILDHKSLREKDAILRAIENLRAGGSTNAEEGLKIGYEMAAANFKTGAINRIILCSDGVANVGRTGPDAILNEIKAYVKKGITLTSVGFGMDNYNDVLMEKLGDKGNGHFAYVDNIQQAKRIFLQNLTGTLQVIARDVKIQVDFNPEKVQSYRLLGYENRDVADDKFRDDTEDGGEIGSGHDVTALYEVKLREGADGQIATVYLRYKDPDHETEVTEQNFPVTTSAFNKHFDNTSVSFRQAACAAEFAEIMRESYWAKNHDWNKLLALAQRLSYEKQGDNDLIEFTALVSRAKLLWEEKELLSSDN